MESKNQQGSQQPIQQVIIQEKVTKTNGETIIKKYSRGRTLGVGGFAKCYEITNIETKKIYAAKIIAKSTLNRSRAKQKLITQIKIHKSLSHKNIVKFEHVFQNHQNVYILLEICSNRTLSQLLKRRKRLTEVQVMYYLHQIVSSLIYLRQKKIIHRDLKLGNLFLNQNLEIKLGDFGLATRLNYDDEKKKTVCGTPNYIAPQVFEGQGHSYQVDIWSLGVIIYTTIIGRPPFETDEVKSTYKKIKACSYSFPQAITISENAQNLINKILVLDPSKRPSLEQIMNDPFMAELIPKTLPKSILGCPPSKNFIEQYTKNKAQTEPGQQLSKNPSIVSLEKANKNMSKELASKQPFSKNHNNKAQNIVYSEAKPINSQQLHPNQQQKPQSKENAQIYVKKWLDYSTKYGLGYLLSDYSIGVYFNDSTNIILDRNGENFTYIQKKKGEKTEAICSYKLKDYPAEKHIQKKVTLLNHFRNYLLTDIKVDLQNNNFAGTGPWYVKKWMKTSQAIMFRLNNKIVQVNFSDKTEIILSSERRLVIITNLKGQKSQFPISTALDNHNMEMSKRLKYTKEILTHMLNGTTMPDYKI